MLVLVGGLLLRLAATLVSLCEAGLSTWQKFLMSLAWLPKTTDQAALGSVLKFDLSSFMSTLHLSSHDERKRP